MGVQAPAGAAVVWTCPECGHGSPEPRDFEAHLDAHRQLRAFFDQWEAAAAVDTRKQKRWRPFVTGMLAVAALVLLAALALVTASRPEPGGPARPAAGPVPGVDLTVPRLGPPPAPEPATGAPTPANPVVTATQSGSRPPTGSSSAPLVVQPAPSVAPTATAAPVATAPPRPTTPAPQALVVNGCLLGVVCVAIGG